MTICVMCGFENEIGADGRCRFGHRVRPPEAPAPRPEPPPFDDDLFETLGALSEMQEAPEPPEPEDDLPPLSPAAAEIRKTLLRARRRA